MEELNEEKSTPLPEMYVELHKAGSSRYTEPGGTAVDQ